MSSTGGRAPGEPPETSAETRRYGRAASLLTIGVGMTGVVTYLFFSLASHNLSADDYGEVVVLWSAVFIAVSILQRPVEQLLSRTVADHEARAMPTGHALRVAATIQLGLAAAFVSIALLLRAPLEDELLSGNEALYWILVAAVSIYAASYFARGFLAGSHRFTLYALLILSESIFRTMFPLAVAVGIVSGDEQRAIALGIVAAPLLSLVVVPFAFARRGRQAALSSARVGDADAAAAAELTLGRGTGFAASVLVIMVSEQTFLNAGPLLVQASSGAAAAGFIFNVLMIARAPLQLFQAVTTSLLPHLTKLSARAGAKGEEAFRASVRVTLKAIAGFTAIVVAAVLLAGPKLMHIAFGRNFDYERPDLLIVSVGMGLYLSAATLNQAALAQGQIRRASLSWIGCAIAFVSWNLLPIVDDELARVEVGYLGAAALLCGLLFTIYRVPHPRAADEVRPDSPEEMELRLAAADEGG